MEPLEYNPTLEWAKNAKHLHPYYAHWFESCLISAEYCIRIGCLSKAEYYIHSAKIYLEVIKSWHV